MKDGNEFYIPVKTARHLIFSLTFQCKHEFTIMKSSEAADILKIIVTSLHILQSWQFIYNIKYYPFLTFTNVYFLTGTLTWFNWNVIWKMLEIKLVIFKGFFCLYAVNR